ncbi:hypothetical protein [Kluyvera intermedia]|uniref:hypothetical protein n=1 Tax=Kluyvera intermedia TaxID=61648 RepID=UPI003524A885
MQLQNHDFVVSFRKKEQVESYHLLNCKMSCFFMVKENTAYFSFSDEPRQIYKFELTDRGFFSRDDLNDLIARCHPKKTFMMKHGRIVGEIIVALIFIFGIWLTYECGEGYNRGNEYKWYRSEQEITE